MVPGSEEGGSGSGRAGIGENGSWGMEVHVGLEG